MHCTTAILAAQPSLLLPGKPQPCRRAGTLIRRVARPKNDAPDEHSDREPKSAPNAPYVSDTAGQRSDVSRAGEPSTPSPAGESMGQLGVGDAVNMPEVSAQPSAADVASYSAAGTGDSGGSGGAAAAPGGGMSAVSTCGGMRPRLRSHTAPHPTDRRRLCSPGLTVSALWRGGLHLCAGGLPQGGHCWWPRSVCARRCGAYSVWQGVPVPHGSCWPGHVLAGQAGVLVCLSQGFPHACVLA